MKIKNHDISVGIIIGVSGLLLAGPASANPYPLKAAQPPASKAAPVAEDSASWKRDPFTSGRTTAKTAKVPKGLPKPSPGMPQSHQEPALQGIMKSGSHYYALVNGQVVKAGDHLDGAVIQEIKRYKITVKRESDKQTYDIYQGKIERGAR